MKTDIAHAGSLGVMTEKLGGTKGCGGGVVVVASSASAVVSARADDESECASGRISKRCPEER